MTDAPATPPRLLRAGFRRALLGGVPLALAAVVAWLLAVRPVALRTSLDDLVGEGVAAVPASVRQASADLVPVLVWSSSDPAAAAAAVRELRARLPADALVAPPENPFAELASDRYGLASLEDVRRLETPEGRARLARQALKRYYAALVPPLFPVAEDPFALSDGFVRAQMAARPNWSLREGQLVARGAEGVDYAVLLLRLRPAVAADSDALESFRRKLAAVCAAVRAGHPSVSVAACGVPLHTAVTTARCRREINALGVFSFAFIALLSIFAFRSIRWIPLLAASLLVAALAGAAALLALFDEIHLMTVVFGTTVMGLVVDYSFHWLLATGDRRVLVRNLLISWLTTEISLVPLMVSSLPVLRQSAVFLGAGLAAALAFVVGGYPRGMVEKGKGGKVEAEKKLTNGGHPQGFLHSPVPPFHFPTFPLFHLFACLLVLFGIAVAAGLCRVRFGTDLTALYRPPDDLAAAERRFAALSGADRGDVGFLVFDRPTIAANVEKLVAEHGARQCAKLGIPDCPRPVRGASDDYALASVPRPTDPLPQGVRFLRPRVAFEAVLARWTTEALGRLACALALMFAALVVFCRRRAVEMFVPSALAIVAVAGTLGLLGVKANLFHLLACFLLAGMSIDYTVFLHGGGRAALKPALCSLLTSLAGFGALAFVSIPVVQGFGLVLGVGLPVGFVAALATRRGAAAPTATELAATPLGLEALWTLYRLFGLKALHTFAAIVGLCAWAFSRRVRRATSARKLVHFTRSLADKLVVMAAGRDLPRVATDGSADAAAFLADVQAGRGVFVLSSHCGTVESLAALDGCGFTFHAWMDIDRTGVFNRFYLRHANCAKVVIHPIAGIGMETAFLAGEALDRGDCLVMAGDRGRGAFRFAHAMGHPVYFVACVWTGHAYRAVIRRLPDETRAMAAVYDAALRELVHAWPDQHFVWQT